MSLGRLILKKHDHSPLFLHSQGPDVQVFFMCRVLVLGISFGVKMVKDFFRYRVRQPIPALGSVSTETTQAAANSISSKLVTDLADSVIDCFDFQDILDIELKRL